MALLLGIDLGTSYFKLGLFDESGTLRGLGRVAVGKHHPSPGRSELSVDEFWRLLRQGLVEALAQAGAVADEIAGISYSSQASTFVLLGADDRPLSPLIMWTDTRGAPVESALMEFADTENFQISVGFAGLTGQNAATKWRWYQLHQPDLWAAVRRVMTISDYLTYALTGAMVGDASTAALLGIYHLERRSWWPAALAAFAIDPALLSEPLVPGTPCGRTCARARTLLGVRENIPFAVGALDHHAAAIGSGLGRLAEVSLSTGTVLAVLALVDAPSPRRGCFHGLHTDGKRYYRMTFDPNGAGQLEAYQNEHARDLTIEQLLILAGRVPAGVSLPNGQTVMGADAKHGFAVRNLLEKISAAHKGLLARVVDNGFAGRVVATGGGSRSELWLQITADILGVPVIVPACPERACLGAAMFAAVATGCYTDLPAAAEGMVRPERTYEPDGARVALYRRHFAE